VTHEGEALLERTLAAAKKDVETVTPRGRSVATPTHGVRTRPLTTLVDDRGTLTELFDPRWEFDDLPITYAYAFTVRPGVVKGWGLHEHHEDRYVLLSGRVDLLLYDVRPDSPTCGQLHKISLNEHHRKLVSIPAFVWHADHNVGDTEAVVLNFPTRPYDHAAPDKHRLPIDTPLIPYDFGAVRGG
jgi:dTDP-4-dehydrorhamnose 3,5-epimerase